MRKIALIVLLSLVASLAQAQTYIYASPTGSSGNAGTYGSPYDLATMMSKCSRSDTIGYLMQGIYTGAWRGGSPLFFGRSGRRTHIEHSPGERPVFQYTGGYAPAVAILDSTTVVGVWFGGTVNPDSVTDYGTIQLGAQDTVNGCVWYGHSDDCISSSNDASRILNCLFVHNGYNTTWRSHHHDIYLSDSNSGQWSRRDIIYRNVSIKRVSGYAWHLWHYPSYVEVKNNFAARTHWFAAVPPTRDDGFVTIQVYHHDNIYWSNDSLYEGNPWYGMNIDQLGVTGKTNHDLVGLPHAAYASLTGYTYGGSGKGDSVWMVTPNYQPYGTYASYADHIFTGTTDSLTRWIGATQATVDSAVNRLDQYLGFQTNAAIATDSRIQTEWNVILGALDTWAGAPVDTTKYYVDTTGNDSNSGHFGTPWKTLAKVNGFSFNPGSTISLARGKTWREQLIPATSGTAGNPITFTSYGSGAKPIINGSAVSSGWTLRTAAIYQSVFTNPPRVVVQDGTLLKLLNWTTNVATTFSGATAGCFAVNGDTAFVWSTNGADPDTHTMEVASASNTGTGSGVYIGAKSYITLDGLTICNTTYNGVRAVGINGTGSVTNIIVKNCTVFYAGDTGILIQGSTSSASYTASSCTVDRDTVHDARCHGIGFFYRTDSSTVSHCLSYNNAWNLPAGFHGISSWGTDTTFAPDGNLFEYNEVYGTHQSLGLEGAGIQTDDWVRNSVVRYNVSHDNAGHGFCISSHNVNNKFYYNLSYHNGLRGINVAPSYLGCVIENNTFFGNVGTGIDLEQTHRSTTIKNNLSVQNGGDALNIYTTGMIGVDTSDYNDLYRSSGGYFLRWGNWVQYNSLVSYQAASGQDAHSLNVYPAFADTTAHNFQLTSSSPAVNAGVALGYTQDILGNPIVGTPDIGAYERQTPPSNPHKFWVDLVYGNDSNTGNNQDSAWKTVSKVNGHTYSPGDSILFRAGQVWREFLYPTSANGTDAAPIVFTRWGAGANPVFNGSDSVTAGWTSIGGNVWSLALASGTLAPGSQGGGALSNVFFNGVRGSEASAQAYVTSARRWYYNQTTTLYVYSTVNPATAAIEVTKRYGMLPMNSSNHNIVIDGIDCTKTNSQGIGTGGPGNGKRCLEIKNNDVGLSGGSGIYTAVPKIWIHDMVTHSNGSNKFDHGIYNHAESDTALVERVYSHDNAGYGLSSEGNYETVRYSLCRRNGLYGDSLRDPYKSTGPIGGGLIVYPSPGVHVWAYYNICDSNGSFGIWCANTGTGHVWNNIIARTKAFASTTAGLGTFFGPITLDAKNNIFYNNGAGVPDLYISTGTVVLDNDLYFGNPGTFALWGATPTAYATYAAFRAAQPTQEVHGVTSDPMFTDAADKDFTLMATSPAIGAGVNVGLTQDFAGHTVSNPPEIGAYEYTAGGGPFNITSSAGAGGTISPNGVTSVSSGGSQSYTITANSGQHITVVTVDGSSQGAVGSYTFSNVLTDHTIVASFAPTQGPPLRVRTRYKKY